MTRVRGDDELLELLGIMGGDNGEQDATTPAETSRDTRTHPAPAAGEFACVPETGWNSSIWNPHVFEPAAAPTVFGVASRTGEGLRRVVSPQEEVLRQQAVAIVFSRFQVLGKELGIRVKNEMFERWQFSRKLKEGRGGDPILPAESFFDPGLDAELQALGVHKAQSRNLCCELGRASKSALKTLKKQLRGVVNGPAAAVSAPSKRVAARKLDGNTYVLQLGKNKLRMNSAHYDKMKELFSRSRVEGAARRQSSSTEHPPPAWIGDFHDCLFSCLMRYEALQGGGFQASMGGDAFDVLLKRFGARMECFASPFNCRYSRYCSAFPDTDGPFGSAGSFFDFQPTQGAYEANPPFVRDVILKMANHMDGLLQATAKALTFVVIIPCWEDSAGWKRLRDSAFLSKHIKLDQKDHGYCEGKQHLRRNRYRLASFHTSVFFLQTDVARRQQSPETLGQACRELERAFALRQEGDGSGGGGGGGGGGTRGEGGKSGLSSSSGQGLREQGGGGEGLIDDGGIGASGPSDDDDDDDDDGDDDRDFTETSYSTSKVTAKRQLNEAGKAAEGKARGVVNAGNKKPASVGSGGSASAGGGGSGGGDSGAATPLAKAEKKKKRAKGKRRRNSDDEAGGSAPSAGGREPGEHSRPLFDEDGNAAAGRRGGAAVVGGETSESVGLAEDLDPDRQAKRELSLSVKKKKKRHVAVAAVAVARGTASDAEGDGSGADPALAPAGEGTGLSSENGTRKGEAEGTAAATGEERARKKKRGKQKNKKSLSAL
ncbi:conserved unknown protein [Ectocarpus siliculosus]|uniref:PCIF1 WW domain-containing protein n=1 Tax=Ectocarpus siliculosus TaxID=2880 RepID=D7FYX1_ECTSI|nr:conserved unknown protein [Ectocarpus siliculosus]|eukprot:CBJ26613.1 conserved unknown protein [Ectocarpus siliculosus]